MIILQSSNLILDPPPNDGILFLIFIILAGWIYFRENDKNRRN